MYPCRWIGSVNAFLVIGGGLVAGQLYDRGHFKFAVYGGSLLLSFGLFMLSLAKPNQFYQLVILNFGSFVGRLSSGFAAHAFGVPIVITLSAGCCSAVILGMIGLKSVTSVVLVGLFFGFFAGAYIALNAPLIAVLTDDFSEIGARMGIAFTILAIGGLIGSPISGALLTENYIWWRPALFSGIMAFIGSAFFIAMLVILRRRPTQQHQ
ncbi:hypothetical protein EW026_g1870 [Hermanssonia centrifuga]|uniref:Major facilitator superfamily (MFS) profile domain-containing protein n=1 Tax=Hermanssonia centrifuga TaxID=98765 RepID=A0A4V3XB58_9APHY|nr:hypothetical protein EW026_g1870 [Hermanssonia centrifuga]